MRSRRKKTILLVDDDAEVLASVAICLTKAKFNVLEAGSGREAIRRYVRHQKEIDLVLTDMVMPDLCGDRVAKRLWKQKPDLPIIFYSGYPPQTLEPGITLEPGKNFLCKPFVLEELIAIVNRQLPSS
jgi:two-component system, cell cycle sensor histidine kinase and response regulator CckA